jgi:4-hydroxy-2-oxoheptanedioate aldolase
LRTNTLKQKLLAGQSVSVIAPFASSAGFVEMLGYLGFDAVFIDCEHGPAGWEDVEHMTRAADLAGYTSILRIDRNDAPTITRALDRGVGGIQIPHVNTADEARAAVRYGKFAPLGERGWSGWRSALGVPSTDFAAHANAETLLVIMLEEATALDNLDEILRVEHVDVFFVAPGDLAQSMGHTGQTEHPAVQSAMDDALRRIRAAGRIAGTLTTPSLLDHHLELGVQFLYINLAALLAPAANGFVERIRRRA